jgi:hypothetical protein
MSSKSAHKLNLSQCLEIQANQYRSRHNSSDYFPELVESRIYELQSNKAAILELNNLIALDRQLQEYDLFLKLNGVPDFNYTYDHETETYLEF